MSEAAFFIQPHSVQHQVAPEVYDRGMVLYLNQQVLDFELLGSGSAGWEIFGSVRGSQKQPYHVEVTLELDPVGNVGFFHATCSCPVGKDCKHAVALTLKAAYSSARSKRPAAVPAAKLEEGQTLQARLDAKARAQREQEHKESLRRVGQWLDLFGEEPPQGQATSPDAERQDRMVYLLQESNSAGLQVLYLRYGYTRRLHNGKWAKLKVPQYLMDYNTPKPDMEIVQLIEVLNPGSSSAYRPAQGRGLLSGVTGRLALQLAADAHKLYHELEERVLGVPMRLGTPRRLGWKWNEVTQPNAAEPGWALRPQVEGAAEGVRWFANSPPLYLDTGTGECGALESPGLSAEQMAHLLKAPLIPQSAFADNEVKFLSALVGLPLPPVLNPPRVVQGLTPTAHLRVGTVPPERRRDKGLLSARLHFDYGGLPFYRSGWQSAVLTEAPGATPGVPRVLLHRDIASEQAAHAALASAGLVGDGHGLFHLPPPAAQTPWLEWLDGDFTRLREAGLVVSIDAALADWIARAETLDVEFKSEAAATTGAADTPGGNDGHSHWFDLSLGMRINGERHNILPYLPQLLAQLRPGAGQATTGTLELPQFVYVLTGDEQYLRLPTEPLRPWLQALLDLVGERGHNNLGQDSVRLSRLEALRMGAALGQGVQWSGAHGLRTLLNQLVGLDALPATKLPADLQASLRPYQLQGVDWLQFLRKNGLSGILADEMGLGKTLQTLAHILVEKHAGRLNLPALIIAPVSLMGNWRREAQRFTPTLKTLVLHGAQRHQAAAEMAQQDLVIAPYSLLQRDRERWMQQRWHMVVLDEAQNIKNANSYAAQVVTELDTRHRLCLSGTPMENHLGELWSLFHFLMPGFLGSQARFRDVFRTPIEKQGDSERLDQLRRRVTPFMLRRAKKDVAIELPDKQEFVSTVELDDQQANLYETIRLATEQSVREALADKGLARSQIKILDALLKLRQVCCDPRLVPLAAAKKIKQSAKLEWLMETVPEMLAEGRRILLFSQFTSMLELIEAELAKRKLPWVKLTGQSQKRDQLIEQFTSGAVPLFLISLKAGGVGLNLPQADTVIHYDPWWNPAVENQATDRAHRIGQTQSVFVYKVVAQGTIEERILALQARKAALADSLYRGAQERKQPLFTEDDVAELLRPLG